MIANKDNGFTFITGEDVIKQLVAEQVDSEILEETSFATMITNIKNPRNFNTRKRQFSTQPLILTEIKITPYIGTKSLLVRGIINSDSGKQYQTIVMFTKTKFVDDAEQVDDFDRDVVQFVASDGEEYAIERINLTRTDIKVRCQCLDYRWRFSFYNGKKGSQYGRMPPPYQKKTDRPEVNPNHVEGCCKHIIKTVQGLMEADMVDGISMQF